MTIKLQGAKGWSLDQIRAILEASEEVHFQGRNRAEVYQWVSEALRLQGYRRLGLTARGVVRLYIGKMTGLSRAQVTRLITLYLASGQVKARCYQRRQFPTVHTPKDIELLACLDEAHETLSGPGTRKILQREYYEYGDRRYRRLARISVAQLYRLRKSRTYRKRRVVYQATRLTQIAIGERLAP